MRGGFGMVGMPPPPPAPPPPPREDDPTFVRRIRLQYMDRTAQVHAQILQDERSDTHWVTPSWVYTVTVLAPYIACSVSVFLHIIITLAYCTKFGRVEEGYWYNGVLIGVVLDVVLLELIRTAITTIVELRKFEIRRRLAGGDFLRSRVRGQKDQGKESLKLKRLARKNAVPRVPPQPPETKSAPPAPPPAKAPVTRPSFLPPEGPTLPPPGAPGLKTATGQGLPVAPGAPKAPPGGMKPLNIEPIGRSPINSARGIGAPGGASLLPGKLDNRTPMSTPPGTGRSGPLGLGAPGAGSLLPGRLDGRGPIGAPIGAPPPPLPGGMPASPSGSAVSGVTQSLNERLKANRVGTPPPPPPGASMGAPPPSLGKAGRLPRAGSSLSGSRPPSQRSGGSGAGARTPPKPPTPPPAGTLQQTRASRRAQQQG